MVTAFFAVSGGHLNPAVTLSALVGRKIDPVDALGYVASQVIGAVLAGLTLRVVFEETAWRAARLGAPGLSVSTGRGLLIEAIFTFLLVIVIWGTAIDERGPRVGGFAIGLMVFVGVMAVGPLTGGAFNPARYLGPAVVADDLADWWVYFAGPGIGGLVGGLLYPVAFGEGFPWARPAAPAAGRSARARATRKR
jgi:aquaporin Z